MNRTGNCTKNSVCTAVNCNLYNDSMLVITTEVTFSPCNDVRTRIIQDELIVIDEISTGNQTFQLQYPFFGIFIVVFILTDTGVRYGVS